MIEIQGKYNTTKIFTDVVEDEALKQIYDLLNQEFVKESKIRFMPDIHSGMGCTIGTTMSLKNKVVPNFVGVDIGCGMGVIRLKQKHIELNQLDKKKTKDDEFRFKKHINMRKISKSLGSLGVGNHFLEVNKDKEDNLY